MTFPTNCKKCGKRFERKSRYEKFCKPCRLEIKRRSGMMVNTIPDKICQNCKKRIKYEDWANYVIKDTIYLWKAVKYCGYPCRLETNRKRTKLKKRLRIEYLEKKKSIKNK